MYLSRWPMKKKGKYDFRFRIYHTSSKMKTTLYKTSAVFLILVCLGIQGSKAQQTQQYYYNPEGGKYIHANAQCDTIDPKYWPKMKAITVIELNSDNFKELHFCEYCAVDQEQQKEEQKNEIIYINANGGIYYHKTDTCEMISDEDRRHLLGISYQDFLLSEWAYQIPCEICYSIQEQRIALDSLNLKDYYKQLLNQNKEKISLTEANTYIAGQEIKSGLFTIEVTEKNNADLIITRTTGEKQLFQIDGPGEYSFALFDGDELSFTGIAEIHEFRGELLFQKKEEKSMIIKNGRYLLNAQFPAFSYRIKPDNVENSYIVLTTEKRDGEIESEKIELAPYEEYLLDVKSGDYRFIEIVNCVISIK